MVLFLLYMKSDLDGVGYVLLFLSEDEEEVDSV
jgi:hypothetical protein